MNADEAFATWRHNQEDLCDVAHRHFADLAKHHWCDVADEACRLYKVAHGEAPEECGVEKACIDAAAAAGFNAGMIAVASMLGVNQRGLELLLAQWTETETLPFPPPINPAEIKALTAKEEAEFDKFRSAFGAA